MNADETVPVGAANADDTALKYIRENLPAVDSKVAELAAWHDGYRRASKGRFNLFTVLREIHNETGLHSRYLAHLLNPQDSWESHHDCGLLFLSLFLRVINKSGVVKDDGSKQFGTLESLKLTDLDCARVCVTTEKFLGGQGRLDIFIEIDGWGVVGIENKINAGEGDDQIKRYAEYLEEHYRRQNKVLLYLTKDGIAAKSAGAYTNSYYRISYKEHILPWIEECLCETYQHVNINQALQQYKNVLYQIIYGRSPMDEDHMKELVAILEQYPQLFDHWGDIKQGRERLRKRYTDLFFAKMREVLRQDGLKIGQADARQYLPIEGSHSVAAEQGQFIFMIAFEEEWESANEAYLYVQIVPNCFRANGTSPPNDQLAVFNRLYQHMHYLSEMREVIPPHIPAGRRFVVVLKGTKCWDEEALNAAKKVVEYIKSVENEWAVAVSGAN